MCCTGNASPASVRTVEACAGRSAQVGLGGASWLSFAPVAANWHLLRSNVFVHSTQINQYGSGILSSSARHLLHLVRSIPCSLPPHFDLPFILPGSLPVKPVQYFHPYPSIQSYLHNGERTMHMRRYVRGRFPRPRRTTNFSFQGTPARFFSSRSSQARRAASETWPVSCSVPRPLRASSLVSRLSNALTLPA